MNLPLPAAAQDAVDEELRAIRTRLLGPMDHREGTPDLEVSVQEKATGVLVVAVHTALGAPRHGSPSTATFELHPHTQGGQVVYRSTGVEYSSAEL